MARSERPSLHRDRCDGAALIVVGMLASMAKRQNAPMLHHLSFSVADLARAAAFYDAALAPLGYVQVWADDEAIGYGVPGGDDKLALKLRPEGLVVPGPGFHLAFSAPSRDAVASFHASAIAHGGQDNGAPGLRPDYGADYFAAFVIDPDGYRIEAVINASETP